MNAADVLTAMLHALKAGYEPALILAEDSPLMESARAALNPQGPPDLTDMARTMLRGASWSAAPKQTIWGEGMMVADVLLTQDETLTLYAHKEVVGPDVGAKLPATAALGKEARASLASEREANAILTAEIASLQVKLEHALSHNAAEAEDAERYRWLSPRMLAADFNFGGEGVQALVFEMPDGFAASADCDATIDAARGA